MDTLWRWTRIEVVQPVWLAALVVLPLVVYYARHGLTGFAAWRQGACLGCRTLLLAALTLALCDPQLMRPSVPQPASARVVVTPADPEVSVWEVRADRQVRQGEPLFLDVFIDSSRDSQGDVELLCDSRSIGRQPVKIDGGRTRVRFAATVNDARMARFTARLSGFQDALAENNEGGCAVFPDARPRALLVEGEPGLGQRLGESLRAGQIAVETQSPAEMPQTAEEVGHFALVVLANVPAAAVAQQAMEALQGYVRKGGGGLIVVGGERAFTPGAYRNTTLERILPVECKYEAKSRPSRPAVAMVVVLDRSISMKGSPMELAKEATRRTIQLLEPRDQAGLIVFDDGSQWVFPLRPCTDKAGMLRAIDTVQAVGRTNMYPAMEKAFLALDEAFAQRKHMILLTDGISEPGPFESLCARIAGAGITVSTVGVGREVARPLLEQIARLGKGHAYFCDDAGALPAIFALETAAAARLGIVERPFVPRVVRADPVFALPGSLRFPSLLGYAGTTARAGGRVVLESELGDPLLAWWRYGKGLCVAFTSDVESRWAAAWVGWRGFDCLWSQLARQAMRRREAGPCALRVEARHGRIAAILDAVDGRGRFVNGALGIVRLLDPQGASRQAALEQVAPGRYAASLPATGRGMHFLEATLTQDEEPVFAERRGVFVAAAEECPTRQSHEKPVQASVDSPIVRVWPWLLMAAVVVFVIDVGLRRMVWPGTELR